MALAALLCFLSVSGLTQAHGHQRSLVKRQEDSAVHNNPFASLSPSNVLEWSPCYVNSSASLLGPISCARLLAPLDYANKSLGTVQLAVLKLGGSGRSPQDKVFYNPGGPGDDPVEDMLSKAPLLRAQVGNDSDIIAVVPRGVGSTFPPMTCDATDLDATRRLWEIQDALPGYTRKSAAESYALGQNLGLDCASVAPDILPYIGTIYAAHDMDFVRQALGQEKLSYLGYSYGTVLGGTYAALFPDKVGRMVLDGVLDFNDYYSSNKDPRLDIGDADLALDNFFQACHEAGPDSCAIWANGTEAVRKRFLKADRQLLDSPLPVASYGLLKWPSWRSGVYNALYRPAPGFPLLAGVASEILDGAAGPYIHAYMDLVQSATSSAETYLTDSKTGLKNSPDAGTLISCSDGGVQSSEELTMKQLDAIVAQYNKVSQFFGGVSSQYSLICKGANLTAKARYTPPFKNITTATPILFVGNTADPTTPIRNAHAMADAFPGSRVLTIKGTGHISYNAARGTRCATEWIAPFFRVGTLPPEGTVCDGKQMPFTASND